LNGNQTASTSSTLVTLNAVNVLGYDPIGMFSSPHIFAPVAGRYLLSASVALFGGPATLGEIQAVIDLNGSAISYGNVTYFPASSASWPAATAQDILKLNANDYVDIYLWLAGPTSATIFGQDSTRTFLTVSYLDPGTP
jgi:hypothetical protein